MTDTVPALLSRAQILSASDIATERVDVPEWGGAVLVRGLTGAARDAMEMTMLQGKGKKTSLNLNNLRAKMVAACVVDEKGELLFTPEDAKALGNKSAAALQRVFLVAQRLSGLSDDDVEELTDSLGEDQSDASGSA